jgi:PKD domain
MRRRGIVFALALSLALGAGAEAADAVVVDVPGVGHVGVALVPGTRSNLTSAGISSVTASPPCLDPALSGDLSYQGVLHLLPPEGLCYHGGAVMHGNETFAEVWDPNPHNDYAAPYVEQFLRDVADSSQTLGTPYAVTSQYTDGGGRANDASIYGGGYDTSTPYPGNGCPPSGTWHYYLAPSGEFTDSSNDVCLTDGQLQAELATMANQEGLAGHVQPGFTPLLVLLTPPGVEVCLDGAAALCSANGVSTAQFCSYHSQLDVDGSLFDYVVQPWTPQTGCDEPDAPQIPTGAIDPVTLRTDEGARLVSPLSQAQMAAIVNPDMDGWFAADGSEINDNGCEPLGLELDKVTVGASSQNPYLLQREFNNGGVIVDNPFTLACAPNVVLEPSFVLPSAADAGDVVKFDGSKSPSMLLVPAADYRWSFGDGTSAVGPSVTHSYAHGGFYAVTLTLTDRGGNIRSLTQTIEVLGSGGHVISTGRMHVALQLLPQSLRSVLQHGLAVRVSSNEPADGIATLSITRSEARRAHLRAGRGPGVVIGRGTVAQIKDGTVTLHLRLSHGVAAKLGRLRDVTLTIRLVLRAANGDHSAIDVAGRY